MVEQDKSLPETKTKTPMPKVKEQVNAGMILRDCINLLDKNFNSTYAMKNPRLLAELIRTQTQLHINNQK